MKRFILTVALLLSVAISSIASENYQWKAKWISKEHIDGSTNTWIAFRKNVTLDKVPGTLVARIAADSKYWLWINGELVVFEGGLKRGPAPGDGYYDKVDIAPFLKAGDNDISVLVWYFGKVGFSHLGSGMPGLLFDACGEGVQILSDGSWQATRQLGYETVESPLPNYRLPESSIRYNAGAFDFQWFKNPEKRFGSALVMGFAPGSAPFGKLVERPIPMWKDYGIKDYESVTRKGDTLVCKLPYNCQVTPCLKVSGAKGRSIKICTDHLYVAGTPCLCAEYITKEGEQEYESLGWLNGEYVYYIVPEDVKVLCVKYRQSGYNAEFTGSFSCDDDFLNSYWQKAARTLYVCMRDTYYDCPDRERAQWWGDEVNELGEAFYVLSPSASKLALKGMYELVGWQRQDGVMFSPVPASNWTRELPMQILASVGWYGFHRYYMYSGDKSFINDLYDGVHRYLHELWVLDENGLPKYRPGDWDWPDGIGDYDQIAMLPCWYALALKSERDFALLSSRNADAVEDDVIIARMSESFNRLYWNGSAYRSPSCKGPDDDRVQALAVLCGFADEAKYPALAASLKKEFHASTYMTAFVLEALFRMGEADAAIDRMHKVFPSVMKDDCSTLWEHWDHSGSCNHAWTGNGATAMGQFIAGIEPVEPGFKTFRVAPQMGRLTKVNATVDTPYGLISIALDRKGRKTKVSLTVPDGTMAVVPEGKQVRCFSAGVHEFIM